MSDAAVAQPEPLRELLDEWARGEEQRSATLGELLEGLGAALDDLDACVVQQQSEAEAESHRQAAADEHRRRLEHDLKLARSRVLELEQALQQRTEELLQSQARNNALAAELQSAGIESLEPPEQAPPAAGPPADDSSVAQRFARLRGA